MKSLVIGGKIKAKNLTSFRFTDTEWYIDVPEKFFMSRAIEVSNSVFKANIGHKGAIELVYNINKANTIPVLQTTYFNGIYYTDGELSVLNRKRGDKCIKTKSYDGVTLYSFEETDLAHKERIRNGVKAIHSVISSKGYMNKIIKIDEVSSEKDTMFIDMRFTLIECQNEIFELFFQRELEKYGVRNLCHILSNDGSTISMLVKFYPSVK